MSESLNFSLERYRQDLDAQAAISGGFKHMVWSLTSLLWQKELAMVSQWQLLLQQKVCVLFHHDLKQRFCIAKYNTK